MSTDVRFIRIRNFILKERLYVLLLTFVVSVSLALLLSGERKTISAKEKMTHKERLKAIFQKETLTKEDVMKLLEKNRPLRAVVSIFSFGIFFAIVLGLFLDFIIFILKKEGGVLMFPTLSHKAPRWGLWDVCKVVILFLWFSYILMFIEAGLSGIFPAIRLNRNLCSMLNATITDILVFVFIIYFVVDEYKERFASLGLSLKGFLKNLFYGIAGYFAIVPALILVLMLIIWISTIFKYEPPMQPVLEIFLEERKRAIVTYLTIFVAVFGPIVEETFFRGFMYKAVKARFGFKAALFSTSAIFALLHANLAGFLPIMILGMLLAYLFEKTGTLVAPCAVHILHNTAMVALVFLMKGILQ